MKICFQFLSTKTVILCPTGIGNWVLQGYGLHTLKRYSIPGMLQGPFLAMSVLLVHLKRVDRDNKLKSLTWAEINKAEIYILTPNLLA